MNNIGQMSYSVAALLKIEKNCIVCGHILQWLFRHLIVKYLTIEIDIWLI